MDSHGSRSSLDRQAEVTEPGYCRQSSSWSQFLMEADYRSPSRDEDWSLEDRNHCSDRVSMVPIWTGIPLNVRLGPTAGEVQADLDSRRIKVSSDSHFLLGPAPLGICLPQTVKLESVLHRTRLLQMEF